MIDNGPPWKPPLSRGTARLQPNPKAGGADAAVFSETLDFPIPPAPRLTRFDELKVVYHRDAPNQVHSARVAVDRFVLVP
jgi:hypothetical protein